jgi:hypothetical protein
LKLREELPYGINVQIERFADEHNRIMINAVIWVERAGQKAIVIGQGGERLKEIGRLARIELNDLGSVRCIWNCGSRSRKTGPTAKWRCASLGTTPCEELGQALRQGIRPAGVAPAYVLHQYAYRDTSRIVEVFTGDHGRLTLFARGANGPNPL